jgi:hypothetical protein
MRVEAVKALPPGHERDLVDELARAQEDAAENSDDPNCYGAGYNTGYVSPWDGSCPLIRLTPTEARFAA